MGHSTKQVNIEPLLHRKIEDVFEASCTLAGKRVFRVYETRVVLDLLKIVTGKTRFNISEVSLEVTNHQKPQIILRGTQGYIKFYLKE